MSQRTFRVIAMAAFGRRVTYKKNDIVKESNFPPGNADKLVKGGFLVEIDPATGETVEAKPVDEKIQAEKDKEILYDLRNETPEEKNINPSLQVDEELEDKNKGVTIKQGSTKEDPATGEDIDQDPEKSKTGSVEASPNDATKNIEIPVEKLIEDLKNAKIPFDINSTKEELYELWLSID
jgi:hypothetical protein